MRNLRSTSTTSPFSQEQQAVSLRRSHSKQRHRPVPHCSAPPTVEALLHHRCPLRAIRRPASQSRHGPAEARRLRHLRKSVQFCFASQTGIEKRYGKETPKSAIMLEEPKLGSATFGLGTSMNVWSNWRNTRRNSRPLALSAWNVLCVSLSNYMCTSDVDHYARRFLLDFLGLLLGQHYSLVRELVTKITTGHKTPCGIFHGANDSTVTPWRLATCPDGFLRELFKPRQVWCAPSSCPHVIVTV